MKFTHSLSHPSRRSNPRRFRGDASQNVMTHTRAESDRLGWPIQ